MVVEIKYIEDPPEKRFMVFAYHIHYPSGGMGDLHGSFDTIQGAFDWLKDNSIFDYFDIFDCQQRQWVDIDEITNGEVYG